MCRVNDAQRGLQRCHYRIDGLRDRFELEAWLRCLLLCWLDGRQEVSELLLLLKLHYLRGDFCNAVGLDALGHLLLLELSLGHLEDDTDLVEPLLLGDDYILLRCGRLLLHEEWQWLDGGLSGGLGLDIDQFFRVRRVCRHEG